MDMSMSMDMTPTNTASVAAASASSSMDMGGMGMGDGADCKISMLWNWYTVDTCFISSTWHNRSSGAFAGSCIGTILLVMALEFLRRSVKEYDRYLIRKHAAAAAGSIARAGQADSSPPPTAKTDGAALPLGGGFRPSVLEQAVRALLHMLQFAVAYFIMLLAMYYNGYIIICIFIGAYLGSFVFQWEVLGAAGSSSTSAANEATVCCG